MNDASDSEPPNAFDAEKVVTTFRRVIAEIEAQTTEPGKAELQAIAKRLRAEWADWHGEDSLHEMAFGEPS